MENLIKAVSQQEELIVKIQQQIEHLTLHQKQNEQPPHKIDSAYSPNMFK